MYTTISVVLASPDVHVDIVSMWWKHTAWK